MKARVMNSSGYIPSLDYVSYIIGYPSYKPEWKQDIIVHGDDIEFA